MQEGSVSTFVREAKGLCVDASAALKSNLLLVLGSIAWWGSHFLLLWNVPIATLDSFMSGYDGRFVLSIAGTIVALGALALLAWRKPNLSLYAHPASYAMFAGCASLALVLLVIPSIVEAGAFAGAVGALLSGIGNSFALVLYGELHARMGYRFVPLACAVETVAGVVVFALLSQLPMIAEMVAAAMLVLIAAALYFTSARSPERSADVPAPTRVDMTVRSLVALAMLTGFAYGLLRTFAIGGLEAASMRAGMTSEAIGTCLSALLLVAVFFLQYRQSLFEQCLLFVVPLVATGMLLISVQGVSVVAPMAVNTGGFACFFNLMWYFAAVLAARSTRHRVTFLVALLFFGSQFGQLLGALVPAQFANAFSSGLMYMLLLVLTLFLYWRAKALRSAAEAPNQAAALSAVYGEDAVSSPPAVWVKQFGLSPREAEIAQLLVQRIPYKQIGEELFVSGNTVKTHVRNIYKKADVSSREELLEKLNDLAKKG